MAIKLCQWSVRVNSLWLWWYCALVVGTEVYLMYRAVNKCKEYNELPWPSDRKPVAELYAYIAFIVISIMCIPFFILTCICKVGNYASDGVRLGRDDVVRSRGSAESTPAGSTLDIGSGVVESGGEATPTTDKLMRKIHSSNSRVMTYWRHCGPLSNSFHILAAFSLLLPNVMLDARKIQHGFLETSAVWETELGAFEQKDPRITQQQSPRLVSAVFLEARNVTAPPPGNARVSVSSHVDAVTPEFVNYVLALIIYSIRYPAVFWYSRMAFSIVFSIMLLLSTAHYIVSYCIAAVFYKLAVNLDITSPGLSLVLSPAAGIVLFILADAVMFLAAISLFNYGYLHYNEAHKKFLKSHQKSGRISPPPTGCQGYFPHTVATVTLVLFVSLRGAMVYDSVTLYRNFNHNVALASIVFDVSYMLIWISLWFCFTIKQEWSFKIVAYRANGMLSPEIYTIQNDHTLSTNSLNGPVPNGHVTSGAVTQETNKEIQNPKKRKKKPRPASDEISNSQFPGFETGLGSPTSALRKSGERKQNRVTFEDSRDETDGADAMLRAVPERSSEERERPGAANPQADSITLTTGSTRGNNTPQGPPVNAKRKYKRKMAAMIHGTGGENNDATLSAPLNTTLEPLQDEPETKRKVNRNIFGDFELSETPENTLKRNYRNSLRSKCGQYYRNSKEFSSPPAAQSSPVLPPKRIGQEGSHRTESPNRANQSNNEWPAVPPARPPPRHSSPGRPLPKRDRFPSPERKAAFSYTNPVVTTESNSYNDLSRSSSNLPSNSSHSSLGLHNQDSRSYPQLPRRSNVSHQSLPVQTSSPQRSLEQPSVHLPPRAVQNSAVTSHARQHSGRGVHHAPRTKPPVPNREIQIVNNKPEMGRRDSALPSSNETSSNDSQQDVLCSQV